MKKIFSFALALISMSAMAEVETLLTYTASGSTLPTPKNEIEAGDHGVIYIGGSLSVYDTIIPGTTGWKLDGDIIPDHTTKYVRLDLDTKILAGDIIYIKGWSGSSASAANPQGFALYDNYRPDTTCVHYGDALDTKTAKNTLFETHFVVADTSSLVGKKRVHIVRYSGKSVFFHAVRVVRGDSIPTPPAPPTPTTGDTVTLVQDSLAITLGMTVAGKQVYVAPHITMVLSDDDWKVSADTTDFFAPEGLYARLAGSNNPTPKDNPVPTSGAYYTFLPKTDGHLYVAAQMGANKKVDVSNGQFMNFYVGEEEHQSQQPISTTEATYGYINFDVVAGQTYYVYGQGTKIAIYGFHFDADITPVAESECIVHSAKCIVNGKLVIRRGDKTYDLNGRRL